MNSDAILAYYTKPGPFTELGEFAPQVDALPADVAALTRAVQMLVVHRFWAQAHQVEVTPDRENEQGYHGAAAMLSCGMKRAPGRIGDVRLPTARVVGNCRHFSTMLCAFLRQKGIPARARCGFSTYFEPSKYLDHWVCEYWNAGETRWVQVDAQLDALAISVTNVEFDPLDVPRDKFFVAGAVWQGIRVGTIDPASCGIADMWGDWFVVGDLTLDVAALQRVELLPWEPFGIATGPGAPVPNTPELRALIDKVAALTVSGDAAAVSELLEMAKTDERLRPPEAAIEAGLRSDAVGPTTGNPIVVS